MQSQLDHQPSLEIPSDSNQVPLQEKDEELHFCNTFSIRYYVFASRQKDMAKNWPFRQEFMQVCMNHGIKNLLPPFQSPGLVRRKPCNEDMDSDSAEEEKSKPDAYKTNVVEDDAKFTNDTYEVVSGVSKQVNLLSLSKDDKDNEEYENASEMASKFSGGSFRNPAGEALDIPQSIVASEDSYDVGDKMSALMVSTKETVQGCNVANMNPFSESKLRHEQVRDNGNSCIISEPMSYAKRQRNKLKKRKRKGRKKRSMVDICAVARPCTLEELDKINGSNWAMDSSVKPSGNLSCHEGLVIEGNGSKMDVDLSRTKPQAMTGLETCDCKNKLLDNFLQKKQRSDNRKDDRSLLGKRGRITITSSNLCELKSRNRKLSSFVTKEAEIPFLSLERPQGDSIMNVEFNSQPAILDQEREGMSNPDNPRPITCFRGKNSKKCINRKRGSRYLEMVKEQATDAKCSNGCTAKSDSPINEGLPQVSFGGGGKVKQRRLLETKSLLHFKTAFGTLLDGIDPKSQSHADSFTPDTKQSDYSEAHTRGFASRTIGSTGFKGRNCDKQKKPNLGSKGSAIIPPKVQNAAQEIRGIDSCAVFGGAATSPKHYAEQTGKLRPDITASPHMNSVSKSRRSRWCPSLDSLSCGKSTIRYGPRCTRSVTVEKQVSS